MSGCGLPPPEPRSLPNWVCFAQLAPGKAGGRRSQAGRSRRNSVLNPQFDCPRTQAISCDELGIISAISVSLWCNRDGPPMDSDRRFTGHVKPAESLTPRIVAAASAGNRASIIDVSRRLYVVQKPKLWQKFFILGPAQPGGRKRDPKREILRLGAQTVAQQFIAGDVGKKAYESCQGRKNAPGMSPEFPGKHSNHEWHEAPSAAFGRNQNRSSRQDAKGAEKR